MPVEWLLGLSHVYTVDATLLTASHSVHNIACLCLGVSSLGNNQSKAILEKSVSVFFPTLIWVPVKYINKTVFFYFMTSSLSCINKSLSLFFRGFVVNWESENQIRKWIMIFFFGRFCSVPSQHYDFFPSGNNMEALRIKKSLMNRINLIWNIDFFFFAISLTFRVEGLAR